MGSSRRHLRPVVASGRARGRTRAGAVGWLVVLGLMTAGCADGGAEDSASLAEGAAAAPSSSQQGDADAKDTPQLEIALALDAMEDALAQATPPVADVGDEAPTTPPTADAGAGDLPTLCDQLPLPLLEQLMGPGVDVSAFTREACTITRVDGTDVAVATITEAEWSDVLDLEDLVQLQADSLDADGVLDPVEVGDEGYAIVGDIGSYVHAVAGDRYLIAYVDGVADPIDVAAQLMRALLEA